MEKLKFIFVLKMWTPILNRFDAMCCLLILTYFIVLSLYVFFQKYIQDLRELFKKCFKEPEELS